jgi:UDP-N-acetylglucosamine transferase subunit ALG13
MARGGYTSSYGVRGGLAVIFVTVGTDPIFRFDRLIDALDQLPLQDLVVQHGPAPAPRGVKEAHRWLSFEQVLHFMGEADTVVGHAGAGTILCACSMGHIPVVMPRLERFGETVDDHQVELASAFERAGRVTIVWDAASVPDRVARSSKRSLLAKSGDGRLQDAVRQVLHGGDRGSPDVVVG